VRRAKVALIECASEFGELNPPRCATWFKDEQGKKQVAETLNESGFDEYDVRVSA
jgi:hypothetical protein